MLNLEVMMFLVRNFWNSGHSLYMDNYYKSGNLATRLLNKIHSVQKQLVGDRVGNPPEVINQT